MIPLGVGTSLGDLFSAIASCDSFSEPGWIALPAATGDDTLDGTTVLKFTVPTGYNGLILRIANQFVGGGSPDGTGQVIWRILQNGQAVQNYGAILGQIGGMDFPLEIWPIPIFEGDVIELTIDNVALAAGGQIVEGIIMGVYYPKEWVPEIGGGTVR